MNADARITVAKFYYGGDTPLVHAVVRRSEHGGVWVLCRENEAPSFSGWASLGPAPIDEVNCVRCLVLIAAGKFPMGAKS